MRKLLKQLKNFVSRRFVVENDVSVLKWLQRRARRKNHREHLWSTIHGLRQEIIDDVLLATIDNSGLDQEALLHKARLIRKYSRRLKYLVG